MADYGEIAKSRIEAQLDALGARPFAHRGLHRPGGPVENTISAFDAAMEAGLGIELDIQLSRDGVAVVFHDEDLDRLTEETGAVRDRSHRSLTQMRLRGSQDFIMTLQDVLHHIHGRTPVLIEAKSAGRHSEVVAMAVRRALEGYTGPVGVMSFDPAIPAWFEDHFPKMLNGLVMTEERAKGRAAWRTSGPARLFAVSQSRAKFLAYDVRSFPSKIAARFKGGKRTRLFTWTVRDAADMASAEKYADQMIVEGDAATRCVEGEALPTL